MKEYKLTDWLPTTKKEVELRGWDELDVILFSGDAYGYVNGFLLKFGIINEPILWLTDTKFMMNVVIIVVHWMSLGTGFLSFVAGLQGIDA